MTRPYTCYNFILVYKDKFTVDTLRASTKGNSIFTLRLAIFCAFTPATTSALDLLDIYTNINLQKVTQLILELFIKNHKHSYINFVSQNRPFIAKNLDLYYKSLHMECYYFY